MGGLRILQIAFTGSPFHNVFGLFGIAVVVKRVIMAEVKRAVFTFDNASYVTMDDLAARQVQFVEVHSSTNGQTVTLPVVSNVRQEALLEAVRLICPDCANEYPLCHRPTGVLSGLEPYFHLHNGDYRKCPAAPIHGLLKTSCR